MSDSQLFIEYFRNQLKELESVKLASLYKEACYISILDALSKTIYPRDSNRVRFVQFFKTFSGWKFSDRVSLTHLIRLLEKAPRPEFGALRKFAYSELAKWEDGRIIYLDREPHYTDIQKLWPREKDCLQPIEGVSLESIRHDNLIYKYRNSLVHELRRPGYGIELSRSDQPYYHGMIENISEAEEKINWELVYPTDFFKQAIQNALNSLEQYYTQNQINPYSYFVFGTYWLEELNQ